MRYFDWKRKKKNLDEMSEAELIKFHFETQRKQVKQHRRKEYVKFALVGVCVLAWTAFCVSGATGIVDTEHPGLVLLLSTGVWVLGIYMAARLWGRSDADSDI